MVDPTLPTVAATASLLLDDGGRLPRRELLDCAVRGALLIDLELAGRMALRDACVEIDTSSCGIPFLDEFLAGVTAASRTTIDALVQEASTSLADAGRYLVATGRWSARRAGPWRSRFAVGDPALAHLRRMSSSSIRTTDPAVWRLVTVSGARLRPPHPSWRSKGREGGAAWLVEAVEDALLAARERDERATHLLRNARTFTPYA